MKKSFVKTERINWIDGLRGIVCILIFLHHFCLAFIPAIHFGESATSYFNGIDTVLSQSPISCFLNGNFGVAIFCMMSSFVISIQVMQMQDKTNLSNIVVKRYFRLMFPVLFVAIIVFIFLQMKLFTNVQAAQITLSPWLGNYYQDELSIIQVLKSVIINTWFYGDNRLSTAFWMLSYLFYGTFISIILSTISWKKTKHTGFLYGLIAVCFLNAQNMQLGFVLGTLLAYMFIYNSNLFNKYCGVISIFVGLFLGGYPSGVEATNIYQFLPNRTYEFWHIIGSFCLLYGICSCNCVKKFLSLKLFIKLGEISYSVYLLHIPMLFSFSTSLFLKINKHLGYTGSVGVTLIASVVLLLVIATAYNKIVEKKSMLMVKKIVNIFLDS